MLNYELAKELKDAGFPQKEWSKDDDSFLARENGDSFEGEYDSMNDRTMLLRYFSDEYLKQMSERGLIVYRPTLSELIEACGENFKSVERVLSKDGSAWWIATAYFPSSIKGVCGRSVESAVANLWLALNPPSTMNK